MTGRQMGLAERPAETFRTFEEVEAAFYRQFDFLCRHAVIMTLEAQRLHQEMVPRPFLSSCIEHCMESGKDLSQGGAKYTIGPVITGIGLAVVANSLAAVKKLVFEDGGLYHGRTGRRPAGQLGGYEDLQARAKACPKYGNDEDAVDDLAIRLANHFYEEIHPYHDIFGAPFLTAFMGISNYIPMGRVLGATRTAESTGTLQRGVSPYVGPTNPPPWPRCAPAPSSTRRSIPGNPAEPAAEPRVGGHQAGAGQFGAMIQTLFALGGFHVQFNCISPKPCGTPKPIQRTTGICWSGWLGIPPSLSISPGPCRTPSSPGRSTEAEGSLWAATSPKSSTVRSTTERASAL